MKRFEITAADEGVRLNRYLEKNVPGLGLSALHKFLRTKRIKRNGKRCEASDRLNAGDVLELYIPEEFLAQPKKQPAFMRASKKLDILFEDENVAILYKPAGLLAHEDAREFSDTLINRFLRHLYEKGEYLPDSGAAFTPALCNRIDRGTEGIVLAAKNAPAAAALNEIIKLRQIEKKYLCVTVSPPPKDGVYTAYLRKEETDKKAVVKLHDFTGAKEIRTGFQLLDKREDGLCLVQAQLFTGRTHQIRAHLAFFGAPILGDAKYGRPGINRKFGETHQLLCSYSVRFVLENTTQELLRYLDGREFKYDKIDFVKRYFPSVGKQR